MIKTFRDQWLHDFYFKGERSPNIPSDIEAALSRKLDIIHIAVSEKDLRVPPGNRFERLVGNLKGWCSVRVNGKYRLIFKWEAGEARTIYLDPHTYR